MKTKKRVRVSKKQKVRIPVAFRKATGFNAGDDVVLHVEDNELRISTLKRRIASAQRLVRRYVKSGESLSDELIAERRATSPHHNMKNHEGKD
jgi:bifunctional DNA-binding transcriptional regulator/antitoxin component of YhaV-PrlF toxin-antitoxin module